MRATIMYGAGDVRTETFSDAAIAEPTDAVSEVTVQGERYPAHTQQRVDR